LSAARALHLMPAMRHARLFVVAHLLLVAIAVLGSL
jgi:hypothetical protein